METTRRRPPTRPLPAVVTTLVGVVLLALTACGGASDTGSGPGGPSSSPSLGALDGRTFAVTSVQREGATVDVVPGTTVTVSFDGTQVLAHAGCNTMSGAASLEGPTLVVPQLSSTEMACRAAIMTQEQWWGTLLSGSPTVAVDGRTMTLTEGGDVVTLQEQEPAPAATLTGTDWHLTSLLSMLGRNNGTVSSVPEAVDATLVFGADGRVNGSTGCNSISGAYTVDGQRITFQHLATTLMACEGPRGDVERSVLQVLDGEVTYSIEGGQLTLANADADAGLGYSAASAA